MEEKEKNIIRQEFLSCVERTIGRMVAEDTAKPFHSALLSEEALLWSRFERSFSTSFGQGVIERISRVAALAGGAELAEGQKSTEISLPHSHASAIEHHI